MTNTASAATAANDIPGYNEQIVRWFTLATVIWALFGFGMGLFIALQLAFPGLNLGEYASFGRLRPLHVSGVVFAFAGNALLATSLYVVQRTCQVGLWGGRQAAILLFIGYQAFLVIAFTGYPLGITQSKEYAEPEWYADILFLVVWLAYLAVYLGTLARRREPHI